MSPPMAKTPGPIRTAAPMNPSTTPAVRRSVSGSFTKTWASGSTKSGSAAIEMPAKADGTCCCPQLSRKKGSAVDSTPIAARYPHRRRSPVGQRRPITRISSISANAPSVVRAQATVSGP